MTLFFHELKRARLSLLIWSSAVAFMLAVCVAIYPEMESQMLEIGDMMADMGSFSSAFGMDQINFGEFMGYFGIECGNVLGLGGALFAAIIGVSALAKEEKDHTSEFLLTLPWSRARIVTQKLLAVAAQIVILNAVVIGVTSICIAAIGETVEVGTIALLFLSYVLLQLQIAGITFGISAVLRGNGIGIGLGLALLLYFMNILSNLTEELEFLQYLTPFGYTDSAYILNEHALEWPCLAVGAVFTLGGILLAYAVYTKKDIA